MYDTVTLCIMTLLSFHSYKLTPKLLRILKSAFAFWCVLMHWTITQLTHFLIKMYTHVLRHACNVLGRLLMRQKGVFTIYSFDNICCGRIVGYEWEFAVEFANNTASVYQLKIFKPVVLQRSFSLFVILPVPFYFWFLFTPNLCCLAFLGQIYVKIGHS